ncbi:MAG: DnaJ domain-containing protein [Cyanobacteriota/Melainabacteria group bacterium]
MSSGCQPGRQGSEEKFKEITEAYEVLKDEDKRKKYDRTGLQLEGTAPSSSLHRISAPADSVSTSKNSAI